MAFIRMLGWTAAAALAVAFFSSCARSSSTGISASEFYGSLKVSGGAGNTINCSATWQVGGPTGTYISLDGGDKATCNGGNGEVTLSEDSSFIGSVSYDTTSVPYNPGGTYTITLYKDGTAYPSTVVLPEAVSVTSPSANQGVTKGSALNIVWNAGSGSTVWFNLNWTIGQNSGSSSESGADNGNYVAPAAFTQTESPPGSPIFGQATATLTVTRTRNGSFATGGLKGGSIEATQQQQVSFYLND